jgi:hypothetical protein
MHEQDVGFYDATRSLKNFNVYSHRLKRRQNLVDDIGGIKGSRAGIQVLIEQYSDFIGQRHVGPGAGESDKRKKGRNLNPQSQYTGFNPVVAA